ncbi:MAG: glycosyltransferase, partial [Micrococcales bacterium]|nr:glycosyltransferase [Micrococcales bacterium]
MNKPDRATVETLAVRQIQAFRAEAAAFPSQSQERGVRSDAGKRSRWGRIKTAAKAGRRPGLGGLIRFGARVMVAPWRSPGPAKPRQAPAAAPAPDLETTHPAVSDDSAAGRGQSLASAVEAGTRLVVAAIMDPFTRQAFEPEAQIVDLHPDTWHDELEASHPDLLFIESAWRGHNDSWHDTVQTKPPELVGIVQWCQDHGIPTVFWNKEDPVYYHRYIKVAELFDHVFSTDLDSIPRYIRDLGHRRVHVLPFAAQPLLCNPIETQDRQARAVFAGSYYQGFAERNKALFAMIDGTDKVLPLEIYDRNFGSQAHFFQWPKPYSRHVVGTLPPEQIDVAYKGCRLALNVNTVTASQTMLARRAFDLVASGTPTVSNYSRSIPVLFGDLVFASNSTDRIEEGVRRIIDHPEESDKRRAMGLRHIIGQHTYEARFRHVIETTSGAQLPRATTPLGLVAHARTADDVARCRELVQGVGDPRIPLVVVSDDGDVARLCQAEGVCVLSEAAAGTTTLGQVLRGVACVAAIRPEHWYGPHYLTSLLEAMAYSTAQAAAKIT